MKPKRTKVKPEPYRKAKTLTFKEFCEHMLMNCRMESAYHSYCYSAVLTKCGTSRDRATEPMQIAG